MASSKCIDFLGILSLVVVWFSLSLLMLLWLCAVTFDTTILGSLFTRFGPIGTGLIESGQKLGSLRKPAQRFALRHHTAA